MSDFPIKPDEPNLITFALQSAMGKSTAQLPYRRETLELGQDDIRVSFQVPRRRL